MKPERNLPLASAVGRRRRHDPSFSRMQVASAFSLLRRYRRGFDPNKYCFIAFDWPSLLDPKVVLVRCPSARHLYTSRGVLSRSQYASELISNPGPRPGPQQAGAESALLSPQKLLPALDTHSCNLRLHDAALCLGKRLRSRIIECARDKRVKWALVQPHIPGRSIAMNMDASAL